MIKITIYYFIYVKDGQKTRVGKTPKKFAQLYFLSFPRKAAKNKQIDSGPATKRGRGVKAWSLR